MSVIPFGFLISLYFLGLINFVRAGNLGATVLTTSAVTVSTEVYLIVKIASLATDLVASNRIVVSLPDDGWYFDNAGTSACSLTYNGEDVSVSAFASSLTVIDIQLDADITDDSNLETQIICTHVLTPSNAVAARSDVNVETRTSLASGDTLIDSAVSTGTLNGIHGSAHVTASRAVSESELNNLATSLYLDISISDDNLEDPFTEAIATDIIQSLSGSIGTGAWNEITFSTPSFLNYVSRVSTTQVRVEIPSTPAYRLYYKDEEVELQGFPASASAVGMAVAASSCTSDFIITNIVGSAVSFQDHQIADGSYFYSSVIAANLDGDTDIDVLFASADDRLVAWYENDGTEISTTAHVISVDEIAPSFIHVADVDNDGDLDILSTSASDNTLVLFENSGGISIAFTMHVIAESVAEASSVFAADLDGDGRKDVIVSSAGDDTIAWYKNENSTGISSTANIITTNADGAACLYAFDADSDGDFDILTASSIDDTITLHRGNGDGTFSITAEIISTSAIGAASVYAADIDADGHMDVIAASAGDDTVAWYRNDGSGTINTTRNIITSIADGASIVIAIDLNGDDLKDVLVGSTAGNTVAWYENDGAGHISTTPHIITTEASGVAAVFAADIDDDGDTDVFVADPTNDNTLWYENTNDVTASATFSALSRRAPTDIDFTFFSAFEITTGLNMVLVLPGFTDADEYDTDTTHSLSISGTDAVYFTSSQAVWNAATQTITLTVDDDVRIVPLTTLSVTISSDSELLAPSGGLSENDENFIYYLNNINKGDFAPVFVSNPGMNGLRTIDLSFSSATVGTSVDLHLQLTFAGVCTDGDTIVITVPDGFTAPSSSIASLTLSGSDASQFIAGYTSSTREITLTKVSSTDDIPDQQVISITITGADSDIDSDVDGLDTGAFEIITPTKGTVGNGVENDDVSDALYQWSISSNTLLDGSRLLDSVQSLSQATFFVASIAYSAAYSGVQSDIVLSFQPSAYMPVGSSIVYTLTGFRFDNILPATLRCTGASDSADDFAIDWDASNYELTFTRENSDLDPDILSPSVSVCTIDSSEGVYVYMPTTGLSENDERLTIETRDIDTDASMILANSPPTALTSPLVDTGIFSVFLVSYSPIYSGVDTEVEIKWVLSSDLLDGEMVTVTCPGLSNSLHPSRDSVAAMTYNIAGNMVADYFRSIEFDDGSDNFIFTVDYPSSSIAIPSFTEVHVLIALSNGITQATSGRDPVSDSTIIETISTNAAGGRVDPTATASPVTLDQGVFLSSSLSFSPQVAGMIASFTVAWSLSGDLQAGESIKVHLPGFKLTPSTNEATMLLECDDSNGDDGYCSLFNGDAGGDGSSRGTLLWNVTTSMLEFTLDTSTAEGIVITGGTSVSVTLPLSSSSSTNQFDLQLPTSGLDTDDPSIVFFSFASASLATNGTSATSTDGISAGEISSSSLSFDPNYPGMLSDVLLSLTLTMDLEPGDEIRVYLPGFVSSSASSSTVSLSVTGDLSSRFDDASAVEWDTDNEFVALRLDSDANTITGHTAIILTIPASESSSAPYSLSTPVNGLFEDDISLSLAVTAQAGDVAHIGFDTSEVVCKFRDSELQFDPSFSGVAADITIIFTMTCSLALGENVVLALPDFKLNGVSTGVSTDITIYVSEGAESSLSAFKAADNGVVWSGSSSSIVLTNVGNDAVAAGTPHSITISKFANLYLPSTGLVANAAPITLASSSSQGSSPPAQAVAVTPGVDLALLDDSRVWFSPSVVGLSVGVYLGVTLTSDLVGGDTITLTLPGFEGPENSDGSPVWLTLAGENWLDFNEENGCLWDQATQTLTLTADSDTFFPGSTPFSMYVIEGEMIISPKAGLRENEASITIRVDAVAGSVLTQAVESVAAIDVCAFTHSELRYGLQNNGILTSINITFAVSGDLEAGDTTRLYLPGFLSSTGEDLILSNSDFGGSSKGDYDSEGAITWNQAASTLTLVRDSDSAILSPSMVKLEMFDVLQLPYDGLGADDDSLQIAVEAVSCTAVATSVEESDSVNTGIFTASSLSFSSLYSGTVTDLNLIVAYSASLAARDVLVLTLSGFTGPVGEVELELDAAYSDTADYNHTGAVIWKSADSTITFTRDWNAPKIDGGTSLTLVVPSSQLIALPTSGVQKNDTRILLSMSAAAGSTEVGRSSPILFTEAVAEGVLLSSSLTFSTSRTGTNCQVNISFTLSHDLHGGDTIEIMLEGFTGPTGSITGVMGDDAGDFDDDAVNSVTWDNNRSALTLTRDNDGLATLGGVSILVSVPLSAGITTPAVGRAADDNAYTISTQSDAGQIIAASVASSTAIDSGVLLSFALDFDPPIAGVETKITITLTCSTSIGGGERFDLSLPGFSSRMRQHNLHNEITGNNGDDFTTEDNAFYDRDTSVLTLIRDSDAVVIPAGTEIEMVIGVLAIRLPTSGLTLANSVEFSEGAVSTAIYRPYINIGRLLNLAPVRNSHCTVFTSVTKGQFLTSSLSFASDSDGDGINDGVFVGQTASISLAWAVTLDMVAGDYIDLHLPGFTHNATESDKTIGTLTGDDGNVYSGEWQDPLSSPVLRLTRAGSSSMVPGRTKQEITISANDGVRIPSDGLSVNDASLLIACTAVSGTVLPAVSISMSSQVSIAVLIASSVHFTPALSGAASEVTIDITLSQDILVGDQIQIVLPGFFGVADGANLSYVTSSSSSSPIDFSDLDTTGFDGVLPMWSAIDETITFTRDTSTYPANIPIQLSIDISNGLKLPATGMLKNSASITVEVVGIPSTPQTSFNTSDAVNTGVFEQAAVSFTDSDGNTPQLGSVVQLSFTIQLSSQLAEGETITLTLTNFQHYTYTDIDAASNSAGDTSIDVGGVVTMILDGSGAVGFGSRAIWDTDAHTLSFTRSIGAGTHPGGLAVDLMLPASNKLVAPTTEVKSDGTAALFIETNAQAGPVSQIKFLSVSSINTASFTSSAMQYSAYITGGDAELTLNFALSCMLLSGGVINIFLAGFEATDGSIAISGAHAGDYQASWSDQTLSLTRTASDLPAYTDSTLVVDINNGVSLPTSGLQANDTSLTIAYLPYISAESVMDSETVNGGVISNSALAIGSLLPGVSTALTFTFTLSMDLTADEEIVFTLPGFTHTSTASANIIVGGGTSSHYFDDGTSGSWDEDARTLTLTVDADVVFIPAGPYDVVISSDQGLVTPSHGNSHNNPNLLIACAAYSGVALATPIGSSDIIGFGSSVIDFNPALSAGTTEISLDFSITGEIITADTVTLHLAEFGGEAFTQDPLSGVDGADWEGTYTPSSLPPTIVLTYTGTTTISSGTIVNLVIDRTEQLRIREREVFADDDTIMISSNAASLGSEGTTPHGIHAITACRTVPIARHVTFTGEKGIDLIVTLSPYDAEPTNTLVCSIPSVPMYGQLYQYDDAASDKRGDKITANGTLLVDASHRVVYTMPRSVSVSRFEYDVRDEWGIKSIAVGFVDVTSQDALLVSSDFLFDDNSWRLFTTPADAAYAGAPATERAVKHGLDSITDTSLSRYIFYDGDADGGHRWYFSSFINRNSVNLYGGVLSFDLYGFSGLFDDDSLYDTTKFALVELHCSSCDSREDDTVIDSEGLIIKQRNIVYDVSDGALSVMRFDFSLDAADESGWSIQPEDDRENEWPAVSECQLFNVLDGLTEIRVYADITTQHESMAMDNFEIHTRLKYQVEGDRVEPPLTCYLPTIE